MFMRQWASGGSRKVFNRFSSMNEYLMIRWSECEWRFSHASGANRTGQQSGRLVVNEQRHSGAFNGWREDSGVCLLMVFRKLVEIAASASRFKDSRSIPRAGYRWRLSRFSICAAQSEKKTGEKKITSIISYYAFPRPMPRERKLN